MEEVGDQDSSRNHETRLNLPVLAQAILGNVLGAMLSNTTRPRGLAKATCFGSAWIDSLNIHKQHPDIFSELGVTHLSF